MVDESLAGYRQAESAPPGAAEKLVVLITTQPRVVVESTQCIENPSLDHKTDPMRDTRSPGSRQRPNELGCITGPVISQISLTQGGADNVKCYFLGEAK